MNINNKNFMLGILLGILNDETKSFKDIYQAAWDAYPENLRKKYDSKSNFNSYVRQMIMEYTKGYAHFKGKELFTKEKIESKVKFKSKNDRN